MAEHTQGPILTREQLVRAGIGSAVSLTVLGTPLLRSASAAPAPLMRRSASAMAATDSIITGYKTAYDAMRALPASDVHSWAYQAAIHGTNLAGTNIAWRTCQHGTAFFWSWHRMYLYYFERIVRQYAGDPNWTLPFWDWAPPGQRTLPVTFRNGGPLVVPNRGSGWNTGVASLPDWAVDASAGMALTDHLAAQGQLELTPHGNVHVLIGGWMGTVPNAALDPIFWLHHANLDRLWNLWLVQGGGRSNPLDNNAWRTTRWTFFDENRRQVTLSGCDVLRAADQLGYTYQGEPTQVRQFCRITIPWKYLRQLLYRFPIRAQVIPRLPDPPPWPLDLTPVRARVERSLRADNERIFLRLDGIRASRPPGVVWQVFLAPRSTRAGVESPFFVGTLPIFSIGLPGHHGGGPRSVEFPVDGALARAIQAGKLHLRFVPAGPLVRGRPARLAPRSELRVGGASLVVERRVRR